MRCILLILLLSTAVAAQTLGHVERLWEERYVFKAWQALQKLEVKDRERFRFHRLRARMQRQNPELADKDREEALRWARTPAERFWIETDQAEADFESGRHTRAVAELRGALRHLERDPEPALQSRYHDVAALRHWKEGDLDEALAHALAATALDADNGRAWALLARVHLQRKNRPAARVAFRRAVQVQPNLVQDAPGELSAPLQKTPTLRTLQLLRQAVLQRDEAVLAAAYRSAEKSGDPWLQLDALWPLLSRSDDKEAVLARARPLLAQVSWDRPPPQRMPKEHDWYSHVVSHYLRRGEAEKAGPHLDKLRTLSPANALVFDFQMELEAYRLPQARAALERLLVLLQKERSGMERYRMFSNIWRTLVNNSNMTRDQMAFAGLPDASTPAGALLRSLVEDPVLMAKIVDSMEQRRREYDSPLDRDVLVQQQARILALAGQKDKARELLVAELRELERYPHLSYKLPPLLTQLAPLEPPKLGEEHLLQAVRIFEDQPAASIIYDQLSRFYRKQERHSEAVQAAQKAVVLSPDYNTRHALAGLGRAQMAAGQFLEAAETFRRAAVVNEPTSPSELALEAMARWFGGQRERAIELLGEVTRTQTDVGLLCENVATLSQWLRKVGRGPEALQALEATAQRLRGLRNQLVGWDPLMLDEARPLIEQLIGLLLESGRGQEASSWLEWLRSGENLRRNPELAGLERGLPRRDALQQVERLRQRHADYDHWVALRPNEVATLQEDLPSDAYLIQYFPTEERLYLIGVSRERLDFRAIEIGRAELDRRIEEAVVALRQGKPAPPMARDLLEPLRAGWEGKQLLLIPSGKLWELPFEALEPDHTISYLFTASGRRRPRPARETVWALGNARDLPGVKKELETVQTLFPGSVSEVSSRAALQDAARQATLLHLAGHSTPQQLFLADGPMPVESIYDLRFKPGTLVVLGSCDSAAGSLPATRDNLSLAHAFRAAGASSVVGSLWPVDDAQTQQFFARFYEGLKNGLKPAVALQKARPRDGRWLPFVLIGDDW